MQGLGRSTKPIAWTGGTERAMVVDGYSWSRLPGTDVEVRALTDRPLALRYRPSRSVNDHASSSGRTHRIAAES